MSVAKKAITLIVSDNNSTNISRNNNRLNIKGNKNSNDSDNNNNIKISGIIKNANNNNTEYNFFWVMLFKSNNQYF